MLWSEDHLGKRVQAIVNGRARWYPFEYDPEDTTNEMAGFELWHRVSLDVASPYKRVYLGYIAGAVGELLRLVASELQQDGIRLSDVIEGIELFNEVIVRNQRRGEEGSLDVRATARDWGLAWYECATSLWLELEKLWTAPGEGEPTSDPVRLWLPGLMSYNDSGAPGFGWSDQQVFHENLVATILDEAQARGETALVREVLRGVDVHWYHREWGSERHIGYLVTELPRLRESAQALVDVQDVELAVGSFQTTVFESGVEADGTHDFVPGGVSKQTFQAYEVARRLPAALVAGAWAAGWHTYMALPSGTFAKTGLRDDSQEPADTPELSLPRPSWYTYQALAKLLQGFLQPAMLQPQVASREELDDLLAVGALGADIVLLEFGPGSRFQPQRWIYVLLRDPAVADPRVGVLVLVPTPAGTTFYPVVPDGLGAAPVNTGCSMPLYRTVSWPTGAAGGRLALAATGEPWVIVAPSPLDFTSLLVL